jgi:molybdopterin adenylyltransferase
VGTREGAERFSFAVITLSDKGSRGEREDTSGILLQKLLKEEGYIFKGYALIPDDQEKIINTILDFVDIRKIDLIVTTGGTGVAPTDVTPEAMQRVIEKDIPGMAEAMRAASLKKTPNAMLSRARAGIRGTSLILNLPGSKKAAEENIEVLLGALPHALDKIQGGTGDCG